MEPHTLWKHSMSSYVTCMPYIAKWNKWVALRYYMTRCGDAVALGSKLFNHRYTLAKKLLYQCGPATINGMHGTFYIEVLICIFHLINDFIIKILIVASTPWIFPVNSTLSVKCILFVLEQPHTIYQETNHLEIWEELSTSSLGGKCQNLSICRNSTSIQHFFLRV